MSETAENINLYGAGAVQEHLDRNDRILVRQLHAKHARLSPSAQGYLRCHSLREVVRRIDNAERHENSGLGSTVKAALDLTLP